MPTPNNAYASTVAAHERQRRKREVSSSYGTTWAMFCERAVKNCKFAYCRSASRKCKNVVFAGVLSPLSFAIERKGAVGDKNKYPAPGRETSPYRRQKRENPPALDIRRKTCYSFPVTGDDGRGGPEPREEMPAGRPVTGMRVWKFPNSGGTTDGYRSP